MNYLYAVPSTEKVCAILGSHMDGQVAALDMYQGSDMVNLSTAMHIFNDWNIGKFHCDIGLFFVWDRRVCSAVMNNTGDIMHLCVDLADTPLELWQHCGLNEDPCEYTPEQVAEIESDPSNMEPVMGQPWCGIDDLKECYQCGSKVVWLAPDSRCGSCSHLTPEEVRGE